MTYATFLLIFIIPLILIELVILNKYFKKFYSEIFKGILFLSSMAMIYTTPWDNYLVKNKIWWYGEDRVLAVIGYVPIEEYSFFILQTILTGIFLFFTIQKYPVKVNIKKTFYKIMGCIVFFILTLMGVFWFREDSTRYLGLIVGWASPVLFIQWAVGGDVLWQNLKSYSYALIIPTFYLWIADSIAIRLNIWTISEKYTTGIKIFNLPMEEAIFFVMTNMMVIQGLQLFWYYSKLHAWGSSSKVVTDEVYF